MDYKISAGLNDTFYIMQIEDTVNKQLICWADSPKLFRTKDELKRRAKKLLHNECGSNYNGRYKVYAVPVKFTHSGKGEVVLEK